MSTPARRRPTSGPRRARAVQRLHLSHYGSLAHHPDPAGALAEVEQTIADIHTQLDAAHARVTSLLAEPTVRALPADRITTERDLWCVERDTQLNQRRARSAQGDADRVTVQYAHDHDIPMSHPASEHSPGISR